MLEVSGRGAAPGLEGVTLRPETDADVPWLLAIYASTRADEMTLVDWADEQKQDFLRMQFEAQHRHYLSTCPGASFSLIERRGEPIGRLYLHECDGEVRIVDIALLPVARGQGVGTALLEEVLASADVQGQRVTIHVEHDNPARRLYERLGFREVESRGFHVFMERLPGGVTQPQVWRSNASS
jgi:ribosomal protein S18 acetylase RimI-like enzyme